jgi:hypothetical protein
MKIIDKDFIKIKHDINGNPRYYLPINKLEGLTHKQINKTGGVKYRGKQYGEGYVFTSYNNDEIIKLLMSYKD